MHAVALRGQLLAPLSLGEVRIGHAALSSVAARLSLHYSVRDFSLIIVIIIMIMIRRGGGCGKSGGPWPHVKKLHFGAVTSHPVYKRFSVVRVC